MSWESWQTGDQEKKTYLHSWKEIQMKRQTPRLEQAGCPASLPLPGGFAVPESTLCRLLLNPFQLYSDSVRKPDGIGWATLLLKQYSTPLPCAFRNAMVWMMVLPPKFRCRGLMASAIVLRGRSFKRRLGHEAPPSWVGLGTLQKGLREWIC